MARMDMRIEICGHAAALPVLLSAWSSPEGEEQRSFSAGFACTCRVRRASPRRGCWVNLRPPDSDRLGAKDRKFWGILPAESGFVMQSLRIAEIFPPPPGFPPPIPRGLSALAAPRLPCPRGAAIGGAAMSSGATTITWYGHACV